MKRSIRRRAFNAARRGETDLRVIGREGTGFRLAAVIGTAIVAFGHGFPKQKEAVAHGERQTGQKARKLLSA